MKKFIFKEKEFDFEDVFKTIEEYASQGEKANFSYSLGEEFNNTFELEFRDNLEYIAVMPIIKTNCKRKDELQLEMLCSELQYYIYCNGVYDYPHKEYTEKMKEETLAIAETDTW